jgi:hypothetical protein
LRGLAINQADTSTPAGGGKPPYFINKTLLHKDSVTDLQSGIGIFVPGAVVLYVTITIEQFEISAGFNTI